MPWVARVRTVDIHPPTIHSTGLPEELGGGGGEAMPWPDVVIISLQEDGYSLDRYTAKGEWGGDTWHPTLEEAKEQAEFEYEAALSNWLESSEGIGMDDRDALIAFAMATCD